MPHLHTAPDEHLEARITAWILGEVSPFEAAELEALCAADPELQLFANRTKTLHSLLIDSQHSSSDHFWKLPPNKREKLDPIIGSNNSPSSNQDSRIRRAAYRTALSIAAILTITVFVKRFIFVSPTLHEESPTIATYSSAPEPQGMILDASKREEIAIQNEDVVHIGGQVKTPGSLEFKEGLTLGDAVASAGGATEFGSTKRVTLYREGKVKTYDLNDERLAQLKLKPNDTIDMPQKHWMGCGTSRNEVLNTPSEPQTTLSRMTEPLSRSLDIDLASNESHQKGGFQNTTEGKSTKYDRQNIEITITPATKVTAPESNRTLIIPAPEIALATPSTKFGDGQDFGSGWDESDQFATAKNELKSNSDERVTPTKDLAYTDATSVAQAQVGKDAEARKRLQQADPFAAAPPYATQATVNPVNEVFSVNPAFPSEFERTKNTELPLHELPVLNRLTKPQPSLTDLSQEISATEEPFSTFSLNISDASFQLALAAIEKGERPDPTSIKPEQFYNAVDYGDPAPSASEPVAAAIDQTAHPLIPGRNLVRVSVRTASTGRSAAQPLRLTLLVDQSGSMIRADRRAAMDTALAQLATLLTENDRITVIGFSRTPHLLADSLPGNEADKLPTLINQTANEGGTNLEQAINLASELALRHQLNGAQNRIVLFTDGAANLGDADPDRLSEKIKTLRQQNLAFDIAGIGTNDLNDRLLSDLARHGNGRYYLVGEKTANTLAAQLAGAFRPAAENVKIQVKFNPQRVGNYKLIGFEKDRLKTEDFRNDAVDAAELAADEAGVAIYQVETLPQGSGEIGEISVRFRDTASGQMVERAWTIPHASNSPSFDKANPKTQLATLALLAAQKLQPGPLADAIDFSNFSKTIAQLKQTHANSTKTQQLLHLINALK